MKTPAETYALDHIGMAELEGQKLRFEEPIPVGNKACTLITAIGMVAESMKVDENESQS